MLRRSTLAATALALFAAPAFAQSWDHPSFFSPRPHDDLGVYMIKPDIGDWGVVGIWRQSAGINLGVRGGVGGGSGDRTVLVGAELFGPIAFESAAPLAFYWVTGLGASFNGLTKGRIPLGVSAGISLGEGSTIITPYVHPRFAFEVYTFDGDNSDTETDFDFDVDVGADIELGQRFILRGGYKIGDVDEVFGLGGAIRVGRGVAAAR
jgi:hypothetical protein